MQHTEDTMRAELISAANYALDTLDYSLSNMEDYAADNKLSDQMMREYYALGAAWDALRKIVYG